MIGEGTYTNPEEQGSTFNALLYYNMLALDDGALSQLVNVMNYAKAFMKGWKTWKQGNKEQAFQTFCLLQYLKQYIYWSCKDCMV